MKVAVTWPTTAAVPGSTMSKLSRTDAAAFVADVHRDSVRVVDVAAFPHEARVDGHPYAVRVSATADRSLDGRPMVGLAESGHPRADGQALTVTGE